MLCIFLLLILLNFLSFELERARSYNYLGDRKQLKLLFTGAPNFNVKSLHRKWEDVQDERYSGSHCCQRINCSVVTWNSTWLGFRFRFFSDRFRWI